MRRLAVLLLAVVPFPALAERIVARHPAEASSAPLAAVQAIAPQPVHDAAIPQNSDRKLDEGHRSSSPSLDGTRTSPRRSESTTSRRIAHRTGRTAAGR